MTAPEISPDDVHRYIERVKNNVELCIKEYMNEEQTTNYLRRVEKIPPHITSIMWRSLQESNPEFFNEYFLRLQLVHQIKTFNVLLYKQAQTHRLIKNSQQPFYTRNLYNWQPWSSPFDQNFRSSNHGQLKIFPNIEPNTGIASSRDLKVPAVPNIGIMPPQGDSTAYPFCPANGSSSTGIGNNMNAPPNFMASVPNSYLSYVPSNNGTFMNQNYPSALLSSTLPVNGNMPQLPMMHDSSMLHSSMNQIGGLYMPLLQTESPMNTDDDNGTVTQLAFGGLTMDGSPPSVQDFFLS